MKRALTLIMTDLVKTALVKTALVTTALVTTAILFHAAAASAQEATIYLEGPLFFRTGPPFSAPPPPHGMTESLYGPVALPVDGHRIALLDLGRSARPDLLVASRDKLYWFDLDSIGTTRRLTPPPVPIDAIVAIDRTGGPREDLVVASGADLWILDLDVKPRRWVRHGPLWGDRGGKNGPQAPFRVTSLAAVDVIGGSGLDLVASDGEEIRALEAAPQAEWLVLPRPPAPPEALSAAFLGIGGQFFSAPRSERVLVASFNKQVHYWHEELWRGPILRRFRTVSAVPYDLSDPGDAPVGQMILAEPRPASRRATDIAFDNIAAAAGLGTALEPAGDSHCPGAVFADLNGDSLPDLYLPRGHRGTFPEVAHGGENLLYFGDGRGGFEPAPPGHGAEDRNNSAGALAFDYDNDGDLDLYVLNATGPNVLLDNDGGRFTDVTGETDPTPADPVNDDQDGLGWGLTTIGCGAGSLCRLQETLTAAAGDFDRDGLIDVYVGNHRCCLGPAGVRDVLYRNNGAGADGRVTFTDITLPSGITREDGSVVQRSTQAVLVADLDQDLWPDIYVTNKGDGPGQDQLFLNRGDADGDGRWDGGFDNVLPATFNTAGAVTPAAMAVVPGDYDNDGDLDLFLTDIGEMDLFRNRFMEDGEFALEVVRAHPLRSPDWGWGASWADFDNDGDLDLHVATHVGLMDYFHQNEGGGEFTEVAVAVGVASASDTRASVPADFDRDGRVDLLVVHRGDKAPALFHNRTSNGAHWLQVELVGQPERPGRFASTRRAVGARVVVRTAGRHQRRDVLLGGLSCGATQEDVLSFGLGDANRVNRVQVFWPSGRISTLRRVRVDQRITIHERDAADPPAGSR